MNQSQKHNNLKMTSQRSLRYPTILAGSPGSILTKAVPFIDSEVAPVPGKWLLELP